MREDAELWFRKAMDDFRVAAHEVALPPGERVATAICFHCQQFVEKALKGFLILHNRRFPRTHNLTFLKALCSEIESGFGQLAVDALSMYAVELRYPGDLPIPTVQEAEECFGAAQQVKAFLEARMGARLECLSQGQFEKDRDG